MCSCKLFIETVSEDVALKLFSHIGFKTLNDMRWFRKRDVELVLNKIVEDLPLLEPFYTTNKKFYVTRPMNAMRVICIYRQLARNLGLKLEACEKGRYGEKHTYYRLNKPLETVDKFTLTFD
jgi:hypothetical protein